MAQETEWDTHGGLLGVAFLEQDTKVNPHPPLGHATLYVIAGTLVAIPRMDSSKMQDTSVLDDAKDT